MLGAVGFRSLRAAVRGFGCRGGPSEWLADIAALRRAGRHREAAEQMRRFHSIYPHYIVPSDE